MQDDHELNRSKSSLESQPTSVPIVEVAESSQPPEVTLPDLKALFLAQMEVMREEFFRGWTAKQWAAGVSVQPILEVTEADLLEAQRQANTAMEIVREHIWGTANISDWDKRRFRERKED